MVRLRFSAVLAAAVLWTPLSAEAQVVRADAVMAASGAPMLTEVRFHGGRHGGHRPGGHRPGGHRPGGYRPGGHRPGHGGWHGGHHRPRRGAAVGAGVAGFAAGALVGSAMARPAYAYPVPVADGAAACAQRFRSYNPVSRTYVGYDGLRHPCP